MNRALSFDILGIPHNSSKAEIKAAYRRLALKYHPDRNSSHEAIAKFVEINKAYEYLIEDKFDYDWYLETLRKQYKRQSDADLLYKERVREILQNKQKESDEINEQVAMDIKFYALLVAVALLLIYTVYNLFFAP